MNSNPAKAPRRAMARSPADTALDEAQAVLATPSTPDARQRHRALLEHAIELAEGVLDAAQSSDTSGLRAAKRTLARAHAARAEDARYGAGQLARGSQRAPTSDDCEDGWERVESIVQASEASASVALRIAAELDEPRTSKVARAAEMSAQRARQLVLERNRSYSFHAEPTFSFGEGWYLAAAAVLASVPIQIEAGKPQTAGAELFLNEAGLGPLLVPPRPRPLANKALPDLVARAFRLDPSAAQARLRAAFLGPAPIPSAIVEWVDERLAGASSGRKVLMWVRYGAHHAGRNTDHEELLVLCQILREEGLLPVLVGDALRGHAPPGAVDLTLFWKDPLFQRGNMRRAQLLFFEHLRQAHGLVGQLGVTTAGMDGPALMGLPTMYLTQEPNVRLGKWVGAVPGYEEVVRDATYLDRIRRALESWRDRT